MPAARHCRHCWGGCPGDCILPGGQGLCIHKPNRRLTSRERMLLLIDRRFWHRVMWGAYGGGPPTR